MKGTVSAHFMILLVACSAFVSTVHSPKVDWRVPERYERVTVLNRAKKFATKTIALTFDDGPDSRITPKVLDILKANKINATFFVLGPAAKKHPQILARMIAEGHVIGNHSWSHGKAKTRDAAAWEVIRTNQAIVEATGKQPNLFRVPYGVRDCEYAAQSKAMGMTNVLWTSTNNDCYTDTSAQMIQAIGTPRNGEIILLHDGPGKKKILAMLPTLLAKLKKAKYEFATIPELLSDWDSHLIAMEKADRQKERNLVALRSKRLSDH